MDGGEFTEKKEGEFVDPVKVVSISPLIYGGSVDILSFLQNLGKNIKVKENTVVSEDLADAVTKYINIIPTVDLNKIIAATINEFEKAGGISASKLLANANDNDYFALMLLDAFGMIYRYNLNGEDHFILTRLGEFIKEKTKDLDPLDRLALIIITGTLFHTKARIIYEAIGLNVRETESLYKYLKADLDSAWKPLVEAVEELKLTRYGTIQGYITETQVVLMAFVGIGMIDYDMAKGLFDRREEQGGYNLYIDVKLMNRLIVEYGDMKLIIARDSQDSFYKRMAPKDEITKRLPSRYINILKLLNEKPYIGATWPLKDSIKHNLQTLYEL